MTGNKPIPKDQLGTVGVTDEVTFHSRLITTTAGTLAAAGAGSDPTKTWTPGGQVLAKTPAKTGRYSLSLPVNYRQLLQLTITPIGPDDAIWGANTTGKSAFIRDIDIGAGAQDGTVEIQFPQNASNADAELPDGAGALITCVVASGLVR